MPDDALIHNPHGGLPRLLEIMRRLRDPESGCPWDIEQDFASIAPYTIEEAYEVAEAFAPITPSSIPADATAVFAARVENPPFESFELELDLVPADTALAANGA